MVLNSIEKTGFPIGFQIGLMKVLVL